MINAINNDPLPLSNRCFLIMTLNRYKPDRLNFIQVDLKSGINLAKYIEDNTLNNLCVYIHQSFHCLLTKKKITIVQFVSYHAMLNARHTDTLITLAEFFNSNNINYLFLFEGK